MNPTPLSPDCHPHKVFDEYGDKPGDKLKEAKECIKVLNEEEERYYLRITSYPTKIGTWWLYIPALITK